MKKKIVGSVLDARRPYTFRLTPAEHETIQLYGKMRGGEVGAAMILAIKSILDKNGHKPVPMWLELSMDLTIKANTISKLLGYADARHWVETSVKQSIQETWLGMNGQPTSQGGKQA